MYIRIDWKCPNCEYTRDKLVEVKRPVTREVLDCGQCGEAYVLCYSVKVTVDYTAKIVG